MTKRRLWIVRGAVLISMGIFFLASLPELMAGRPYVLLATLPFQVPYRCTGAMRILAFIEPACADTADREDPDPPRVVARPSPQPTIPVAVGSATGRAA